MNVKHILALVMSLAVSTGPLSAEIDISATYSETTARALTDCIEDASSAEDVAACAEPYLFQCLKILDETRFAECRRTALFWWDDRVEEAREIEPVRVKVLEQQVQRMRCSDSTILGDYLCQEQKYGVIYMTVMAENLSK